MPNSPSGGQEDDLGTDRQSSMRVLAWEVDGIGECHSILCAESDLGRGAR